MKKNRMILYIYMLSLIFNTILVYAEPMAVSVITEKELYAALEQANRGEIKKIILQPGEYILEKRLIINKPGVSIIGATQNPNDVVLIGKGMHESKSPEVLIDVSASSFKLSGATIRESGNHLIQIRAEKDADDFSLTNCILQDSYEQMIKVSGGPGNKLPTSDNGLIQNCTFEYTEGIGPQYYIGGIDAHRAHNWTIKNNIFRNIASPSDHVAEHAIHLWNYSYNNTVEGNTIINSDRAIGFGMGNKKFQSQGGLIAGNIIIHTDPNHPFADVGIVLEGSPDTMVLNNVIFATHEYPNGIEYRFSSTNNVLISNNVSNKAISSRDGATAALSDNKTGSFFSKYWQSLLHLLNKSLH